MVVITGASSGMGKEITYRYAERGCKIVIGSRNIKDLTAVRNASLKMFVGSRGLHEQVFVLQGDTCIDRCDN